MIQTTKPVEPSRRVVGGSQMIKTKRVYEKSAKEDGTRVLVDRLWPRGISKKDARIDEWLREIAPSDKLRKWFGHDPSKWEDFKRKYMKELEGNRDLKSKLEEISRVGTLTLVYSAKDEMHNQAIALKEFLEHDLIASGKVDQSNHSSVPARTY
jgi:uncharacterized protein YeaO (DUF488 family)